MRKEETLLFEKKPASSFEEGYLLGNGSIGATVFGGFDTEKIILNHDTLWSGYPREDVFGSGKKEALDKARELIDSKKYNEADALLSKDFSSYASDAYLPACQVNITYKGAEGRVFAYRRSLDISDAICGVSFKKSNVSFKSNSFVSHTDDVFVWRLECSKKQIFVDISLQSELFSRTFAENNSLILEGEAPVSSEQNQKYTDRKAFYYDEPKKRGIRYAVILKPITDGEIKNRGNFLSVSNSSFLEIRCVIKTSYNGYDKSPFTEGLDYLPLAKKAMENLQGKEYDYLLKRHVSDFKKLFLKTCLDLGGSGKGGIPTSLRLERYKNGQEDKALITLLFNYGRYLTISASRKGSQAMNLQGIWNPYFFAPWHSNYTININTQMNYFPTLFLGLFDCYEPLLTLIEELSVTGRNTAKIFYDADGWVVHHNTDIWRYTQPVGRCATWMFANTINAWLCRHLYDYYLYTLDDKFLKVKAYPIMREAARFLVSQLRTDKDGYRIISPATSPENEFSSLGEGCAVAETTEFAMATVRELFGNLISAAEILGENDEVLEKVKEEIDLLLPTRISSDGRITEWYYEMEETDKNHRHLSHLYGLHPSNQITKEKTPSLYEAARKSLEVRGDEGTGWSMAWKANMWARLGDGNRAVSLIKTQLRPVDADTISYTKGGSYINLNCAHPPFQIDGNFGALSAICEMLVSSEVDKTVLLPALPDEWKDISVKGLCLKGRRKLSLKVKDGILTECVVEGEIPKSVIYNGRDIASLFIASGKKQIFKDR